MRLCLLGFLVLGMAVSTLCQEEGAAAAESPSAEQTGAESEVTATGEPETEGEPAGEGESAAEGEPTGEGEPEGEDGDEKDGNGATALLSSLVMFSAALGVHYVL